MTAIAGTNPYTGERLAPVVKETPAQDVERIVRDADTAFPFLRDLSRGARAGLLGALADGVDADADELIAAADEETGIGTVRLTGELKRASFQLRFFADVLREGSYLEAAIDPAGETPMGPRPDLRRILRPLGPVAVFGSSNFPFAFSVLGGDTASAIAAGCTVVLKAHSSHPRTSKLSYEVLRAAAERFGAPAGTVGIVYGQQAGVTLVGHPLIHAVGFTGSLGGGNALMAAIARRDQPIPFYGEMSSINPLIVTPAAAQERAAEIGSGLAASITTSAGQLCTKPGAVFLPDGADGDRVLAALTDDLARSTVSPLLNRRIFEDYATITTALDTADGIRRISPRGEASAQDGFRVVPAIYTVAVADLGRTAIAECFGPSTVVVRYADTAELFAALGTIEHSLTMTLHFGADDELTAPLTKVGEQRSGRVVYDGYPTGVSVSWAQTHGGPWPSTNSLHTSVGATAIRRFLRPVTFQNAPQSVLPPELRDGPPIVPLRIDGVLTLPAR